MNDLTQHSDDQRPCVSYHKGEIGTIMIIRPTVKITKPYSQRPRTEKMTILKAIVLSVRSSAGVGAAQNSDECSSQ